MPIALTASQELLDSLATEFDLVFVSVLPTGEWLALVSNHSYAKSTSLGSRVAHGAEVRALLPALIHEIIRTVI